MSSRISVADLCEEPFRLFFPLALIAGIAGVALWPLHFAGFVPFYPGTSHARLMGHGFFGGFIVGFLCTALPRMFSARSLSRIEVVGLLLLYLLTTIAHALGYTVIGDAAFLVLLIAVGMAAMIRFRKRRDLPPPGFVLVALAFLCVASGMILVWTTPSDSEELSSIQLVLPRLMLYQGFILLPILGVGVFLLPRFFGVSGTQNFPESRRPSRAWSYEAGKAGGVGLLVIGSFWVEAVGWYRVAHIIRFGVVASYLWSQTPVLRAATQRNTLSSALRAAVLMLLAGFLLVAVLPAYRVAFLHVTLIGGFAIITLTVATRVVFGHSGNRALLQKRNRWFTAAAILMLVGMGTRISGDLFPKILVSHYNYGALLWVLGVLIWARYVIPKVLVPDTE